MIPQRREMGIQAAGHGKGQVFPVAMVGRRHDHGARRLDQIIEGLGEDTRRVEMLHHFQTDDDWERSVDLRKAVVGRSRLE